jgi:drug/metabolite transporter (DMT)-like permease
MQIIGVVAVVAAMAGGQVLLKLGADHITSAGHQPMNLRAVFNPYLLAAAGIYAVTMFAWVWVLSAMHLSRAYPFLALAFIFTPLLAFIFLHEPITKSYLAGSALIVLGLYLIAK